MEPVRPEYSIDMLFSIVNPNMYITDEFQVVLKCTEFVYRDGVYPLKYGVVRLVYLFCITICRCNPPGLLDFFTGENQMEFHVWRGWSLVL